MSEGQKRFSNGLMKRSFKIGKQKDKERKRFEFDESENRQFESYGCDQKWTIGEDVILLRHAKKNEPNIVWNEILFKLKKKDAMECQRRYIELREPKDFEYEAPEEVVDREWTQDKISVLMFSYMQYDGDWIKIRKKLPQFTLTELQEKIKFLNQKSEKKFRLNEDYKLFQLMRKKLELSDLAKFVGRTEDECTERIKEVIEYLNNLPPLQKREVNVASEKQQEQNQESIQKGVPIKGKQYEK